MWKINATIRKKFLSYTVVMRILQFKSSESYNTYQTIQTHSSENISLYYQRLPHANTYRPSDEALTPPLIVILILFNFLPLLFILTLSWFTPWKQKRNYLILMVFPLMLQILNIEIQNCKELRSPFPHKLRTYYFTIVQPDDGILGRNVLLK
jgi:hypothetical protein